MEYQVGKQPVCQNTLQALWTLQLAVLHMHSVRMYAAELCPDRA